MCRSRIVAALFLVALTARPAHAAPPEQADPQPAEKPAVAEPYGPVMPLPRAAEDELSSEPRTVTSAEPPPAGLFPSAPPAGPARILVVGVSAGPGWLALHDQKGRDAQGAMALSARLSAVLAPDWCVFLAADHVRAERGTTAFRQTAGLMGLQRSIFGRVYLGAAVAVGLLKESMLTSNRGQGPGPGFSGLVGVEVLRGRYLALTVEAGVTVIEYPDDAWEMGGLRLGIATF